MQAGKAFAAVMADVNDDAVSRAERALGSLALLNVVKPDGRTEAPADGNFATHRHL